MADDVLILHDARRTYHFWIDDAIIDHYGPQLGSYGIALYCYLARRAKASKAFPGQRRICKDLAIGHSTVQRTLKTLQDLGLIAIERRVSTAGDLDTNLYTINDLTHLHAKGVVSGGTPIVSGGTPVVSGGTQVVSVGVQGGVCTGTKGFSVKDPQLKGEENSLTTFESLTAAACTASTAAPPPPRQRSKWLRREQWEITGEGWFFDLLMQQQELWQDVAFVLNLDWWHKLDKVYPLEEEWLVRQFDRMRVKFAAGYPRRTSAQGWKKFLTAWIEHEFAAMIREKKRERRTYAQENHTRR